MGVYDYVRVYLIEISMVITVKMKHFLKINSEKGECTLYKY